MRALFTVASAIGWLLIAGFMSAVGMVIITLDVPGGMLCDICLLVGHILPLGSFDGPHLYRK